MSIMDCEIRWDAGAVLQELVPSSRAVSWVGDQIYSGTIAGAVRLFATLPEERQMRVEMFVDRGSIEGSSSTILGFDDLSDLTCRADFPMA